MSTHTTHTHTTRTHHTHTPHTHTRHKLSRRFLALCYLFRSYGGVVKAHLLTCEVRIRSSCPSPLDVRFKYSRSSHQGNVPLLNSSNTLWLFWGNVLSHLPLKALQMAHLAIHFGVFCPSASVKVGNLASCNKCCGKCTSGNGRAEEGLLLEIRLLLSELFSSEMPRNILLQI